MARDFVKFLATRCFFPGSGSPQTHVPSPKVPEVYPNRATMTYNGLTILFFSEMATNTVCGIWHHFEGESVWADAWDS